MNFSKLDRLIDTMPDRGIPGCDLAVTCQGKEVYHHQAGVANQKTGEKVNANTMWKIYSASKISTCIGAMQLVEQGKLSLEDKVSDYIPEFANLKVFKPDGVVECQTPMKIIHLFTMTAGLDYDMNIPGIQKAFAEKKGTLDVLRALPEKPLQFEPGSHYLYSLCHDVLGAVIEVVSGMTLFEYLKKKIYAPLGMKDTVFNPDEEQAKRVSDLYTFDTTTGLSHLVNPSALIDVDPNYESGGGGIFSTAGDYVRLMTALAMGGASLEGARILKPETVAMLEVNRLSDQCRADLWKERLYGYSWGLCGRVHINPAYSISRSSVGEFGWDGAAAAYALADRKKGIALYFGTHVMGCGYAYNYLHPLIRDMVYEAIED